MLLQTCCYTLLYLPVKRIGGGKVRKSIALKKRPCRICHLWFRPNARLKDRQKTCGAPRCKREWHRKKCSQWNNKHPEYFKANYLQGKIGALPQSPAFSDKSTPPIHSPPPPKSRMKMNIPRQEIQEVMGAQHFVIMEYLFQLLLVRVNVLIKPTLSVTVNPAPKRKTPF